MDDTDRGDSMDDFRIELFIFPDGTALLVDAGELPTKTAQHTPDRPDSSRPAGEWIVRYIRQALAHDPQPVQSDTFTYRGFFLMRTWKLPTDPSMLSTSL